MNVFISFFIFLTFLSFSKAEAVEIKLAAAANLQSVLPELIESYKKQGGGEVITIIGSSGKLVAQIENGAPFDVFMSADMKYPQALSKEGLTTEEPKIYAIGELVMWTTRSVDLDKGVAILTDKEVKKIAIASPQAAPYGREAVNAMKFYGIYPQVQDKLVYGENISQTNDYIVSGAADIGFTSKSTVLSPNLKEKGRWVELPAQSYKPIAQGVVILKRAKPGEAQRFYSFLFSNQAKEIFKKYGYKV